MIRVASKEIQDGTTETLLQKKKKNRKKEKVEVRMFYFGGNRWKLCCLCP
jgi:hypothetical protein